MSAADFEPPASPPHKSSRLLWLLIWCVALTGAVPYLFFREVMNPAIALTVGGHLVGGLLLTCLLIPVVRLLSHLSDSGGSTRLRWPLVAALIVGTLSGLGLFITALMGRSIDHPRVVYAAHLACGLALAIIVAALFFARMRRGLRAGALKPSGTAAAALLLLSGCSLAASNYAADTYFTNLTASTSEQASNPYFPAGSHIERSGDWSAWSRVETCGQAGCHPAIVEQWKTSGHARSHNGAAYQAALASSRQKLGADGVKWCAGCHAPLLLPSIEDSPAVKTRAQGPSVDCLSCHAMSHVTDTSGNGRAYYSPPAIYPFAGSKNASEQWLNGFLFRLKPAPHKASLAGPAASPASLSCAPCHRLSVGPQQNSYKYLRYDNTWGDWQASGFSGESAHAFTVQPLRKNCVDCHMPAEPDAKGFLHNHSGNAGAEKQYKVDPLHVEIFALRSQGDRNGPETVDAPLAASTKTLSPGQTVTLDVLVENRGIGHAFPGGMRQAWLDLSVVSSQGKQQVPILSARHNYGLLALDRSGNPVDQNNFYTMVAPVSVRTVAAGEGEVARFRFKVPQSAKGELELIATLHYSRSESDSNRSDLMAEHTVTLQVAGTGVKTPAPTHQPDPPDASRLYAYGAALLRPDAEPEQLSQARWAFQQALRIRPRSPDYMTALGRTYLAEGDLLSARAQFELALRSDARAPGARAWLGNVLLRMGQFEKALTVINPLLREYPRDRLLLMDAGLCYLKSAQYNQAAEAFNQSLEMDPDDASAHYNLMRCYMAMNRLAEARREEAIFRALQDDEPLSTIIEPYLQKHPEVRRESLRMHVHDLSAAK